MWPIINVLSAIRLTIFFPVKLLALSFSYKLFLLSVV